ncbi:MAG: hypothetical protein ACK55Z_08180 [bacterium]
MPKCYPYYSEFRSLNPHTSKSMDRHYVIVVYFCWSNYCSTSQLENSCVEYIRYIVHLSSLTRGLLISPVIIVHCLYTPDFTA